VNPHLLNLVDQLFSVYYFLVDDLRPMLGVDCSRLYTIAVLALFRHILVLAYFFIIFIIHLLFSRKIVEIYVLIHFVLSLVWVRAHLIHFKHFVRLRWETGTAIFHLRGLHLVGIL